ncbi:hypothetical protein JZ751_023629 [Albula glossodonta]|uniref:Uncharacterized protein n=1 Tax=Albula glossodonta TaxID=121402 RepID=A0A8T2NGV3_9TELE|nr:hypothetical protein JZ751_023629 [Albula glossodonta]
MNSSKRTTGKKMPNRAKINKSGLNENAQVARVENLDTCVENGSPSRKIEETNVIPTGRQLPRTPVKRTSLGEKKDADENVPRSDFEEVAGNTGKVGFSKPDVPEQHQLNEGQNKVNRRPSTISVTSRHLEEMEPDCFIQGMVGYQWTQEDLEFVQRTKNGRQIQQLKSELSTLLKQLEEEHKKRDLALAAREKMLVDHPEIAAFGVTVQLARDFLRQKLGASDVEALEPESLLEQIQIADVQQATRIKRAAVTGLEKRLAKTEKVRKQQEKQNQESERQKKSILQKQAKVDGLNNELSELKSQLSQAEAALRDKQKQVEAMKALEPAVKESEVDMAKVVRRSKRIAKRKENFLERDAILKKISALN